MPVMIAVPTLSPMWKLNKPPIALATNIRTPPSTEFPISFAMLFRGNIKNLPIINKNIIHAK